MFSIPESVRDVLGILQQNKYEAYIVGGCVRDALLGDIPSDYDVTTSANPQDVMRLFEKTIPTGIKHGTVTVISKEKTIEVTTFRADGDYSDSRRPDNVCFVETLAGDLSRRDFTVNALAFNEETGLVDLFGGENDLKNKILRAVGDPQKRFCEDALRILRLFRFAAKLGFAPEENTLIAALKEKDRLQNISRERIATELKKAVCGPYPEALAPIIEVGGLAFLGIDRTPDFKIISSPHFSETAKLFFTLYTGCAYPQKTANELKLSNREKQYFANMLYLCNNSIPKNAAELKNAMFMTHKDAVDDWLIYLQLIGKIDPDLIELKEKIIAAGEPYLIEHLEIDGNELKEMGLSGNEIGKTLEFLRRSVVENPQLNQKNILKNMVNNL